MSTTARAHPNIALLKYWGKQDRPGNYPATPSVSITLDTLSTTTTIEVAPTDRVWLNEIEVEDAKVGAALEDWRQHYDIPSLSIKTRNNFPTAAGLASSASGFAALITAIDAHCELSLSDADKSDLARRASGSAARSIHGGFVTLAEPDWQARQLLPKKAWPLRVVIAITTIGPKAVSSSVGMERSRLTSPYFEAWVSSTASDYGTVVDAVTDRDFDKLAELAEASCLKMHALMLSSKPGLVYWHAATVACMHEIRALREQGLKVFFTVDAGPQVKAVCTEEHAKVVQQALANLPGVEETIQVGLGQGATVIDG
ncbi:MAG: diphosphomevalonate decarboxylase [Gammaproteobacteria bacterium]|nr:diphosphomevalonate decarboxylase [Gammaproteobacteria bacterium]